MDSLNCTTFEFVDSLKLCHLARLNSPLVYHAAGNDSPTDVARVHVQGQEPPGKFIHVDTTRGQGNVRVHACMYVTLLSVLQFCCIFLISHQCNNFFRDNVFFLIFR